MCRCSTIPTSSRAPSSRRFAALSRRRRPRLSLRRGSRLASPLATSGSTFACRYEPATLSGHNMLYRKAAPNPPRLLLRIAATAGAGALLGAAACSSVGEPHGLVRMPNGLVANPPADAADQGDSEGTPIMTGVLPQPQPRPLWWRSVRIDRPSDGRRRRCRRDCTRRSERRRNRARRRGALWRRLRCHRPPRSVKWGDGEPPSLTPPGAPRESAVRARVDGRCRRTSLPQGPARGRCPAVGDPRSLEVRAGWRSSRRALPGRRSRSTNTAQSPRSRKCSARSST